jgi:hypothetical protein
MLPFLTRLFQRKNEPAPPTTAKRSTLMRLQTTCIRTALEIEKKPSSRPLGRRG